MLLFILMLTILPISYAFGVDMSGNWKGVCKFNGKEFEQEIDIKNDLNSISIDGDLFSLNSTTTRNHAGVEDKQEWKEITVYDWQWNKDQTIINTNARWLGWFVNQNGAWTGRGTGYIKMNGSNLKMARSFEIEYNGNMKKNDELCIYSLKK